MTKTKVVKPEEVEEHEYAVELAVLLDKVLKFLVRHSADKNLIEAVCEVIEDNEQWINKDLLVSGSP